MTEKMNSDCSRASSSQAICTREKETISDFRRGLPQFCVVGVKNLILLGWGLILGYPTILIPGLQAKSGNATSEPEFVLGPEEISWIGSINLLFVPFGSIASAVLMDPFGKRRVMQLLNLPMLAAWALFYFATSMTQIYIGLCLMGMSGGLLEAPLLLYIAETVEPKYRGMLTASGTATVLGGVCLQFVIGGMFHWRTVAAVSAIIPFLAFNAVFLVPETPYWLFARDRAEEAHKSLQWLRGWVTFNQVEDEFKGVMHAVEDLKAERKSMKMERQSFGNKLKPFKKRSFVAPFSLVISGFIFGHFSGMTPLQTYAIDILASYKVPINEYYATIYLGVAQFVGCILGMALVRTIGKRRIVFISFIGCAVCFFAVATQAHYLYGSNQRGFDSQDNSVNSSIRNLEQNTLDVVFAFRDRINNSTDNEFVQITVWENDSLNLTESEVRKLKQIYDLLHNNSLDIFESNQISNWTVQSGIDVETLLKLINVNKIILQYIPNKENRKAVLKSVKRIEKVTWEILESNKTEKTPDLQNKINEFSSTLSTFAQNIGGKNSENEHEINSLYRWMPLIIILAGSMFAHLGAKLFPWMLIGEVYTMDVRSAAAGISSAMNYFIGFLSNKLFLSMVATFTLNGTFWFYSAIAFVGILVLYFILPETEGRTLEEVQAFFDKRKRSRVDTKSNQPSNIDP